MDFIDLIAAYGYALHNQLDRVVGWFRAVGSAAIPLVVGAILAFWAWRIFQKRRLIRLLRTRRLTPDQLRARLESDDPIRIVDLRAAIEYEVTRQTVPGAIRMDPENSTIGTKKFRVIATSCSIARAPTRRRVRAQRWRSSGGASSACFRYRAA